MADQPNNNLPKDLRIILGRASTNYGRSLLSAFRSGAKSLDQIKVEWHYSTEARDHDTTQKWLRRGMKKK